MGSRSDGAEPRAGRRPFLQDPALQPDADMATVPGDTPRSPRVGPLPGSRGTRVYDALTFAYVSADEYEHVVLVSPRLS